MKTDESIRRTAWNEHNAGRLSEAEALYRELLSNKQPQDSDVSNLGALLRSQGRLKEAISLYQRWIDEFSEASGRILNAVNAAIESNNLDLGERWLKKGINEDPESLTLHRAYIRLLQSKDEKGKALYETKKLSKKYPDNAEIKLEEALLYYKMGDLANSLEQINNAETLDAQNPKIKANKITILQEQGKSEAVFNYAKNLDRNMK